MFEFSHKCLYTWKLPLSRCNHNMEGSKSVHWCCHLKGLISFCLGVYISTIWKSLVKILICLWVLLTFGHGGWDFALPWQSLISDWGSTPLQSFSVSLHFRFDCSKFQRPLWTFYSIFVPECQLHLPWKTNWEPHSALEFCIDASCTYLKSKRKVGTLQLFWKSEGCQKKKGPSKRSGSHLPLCEISVRSHLGIIEGSLDATGATFKFYKKTNPA